MTRRRRRSAGGSKENRYAHLQRPQAVLDFHELGPIRPAEVRRRTIDFVEEARDRGLARVRIVTGKGLHSTRGPVVKPQVLRTLSDLEREGLVRGFHHEKLTEGGDGAWIVEL